MSAKETFIIFMLMSKSAFFSNHVNFTLHHPALPVPPLSLTRLVLNYYTSAYINEF